MPPQTADRPNQKEVIDIGHRCQASLDMQRRSLGSLNYDHLPIYGTVLGDLFGIRFPLAAGKVMTCSAFTILGLDLMAILRSFESV
jgi:hypothetical protein